MREPIDGPCEEALPGDLVDWAIDGRDDTKFMAAITDENAVGRNCLECMINVDHLCGELDSQMLKFFATLALWTNRGQTKYNLSETCDLSNNSQPKK